MNFDWLAYYRLAELLKNQALNPGLTDEALKEAMLRSAISRAYYAVFIEARNYLDEKGQYFPRQGENVHYYVREQFSDERKTSPSARIKQALFRLSFQRNICDYENPPIDKLETSPLSPFRLPQEL